MEREALSDMHRLALRILGDHARAEDSVQEAFLRVWIKRADWRNEGARFSTWLHRVVFNCCLDVKRRRHEEELKDDAEPADESDDAVATIHHEQIVARLRSAMSKLPEQQYLALIMYYHGFKTWGFSACRSQWCETSSVSSSVWCTS